MPEWLLQTLIGNAVWTIVAFVVGLTVAWFQGRGSRLIIPLFYGLGAMIALLIIGVLVRLLISPNPYGLTREDPVELNLRKWLAIYQLRVEKFTEPDAEFALSITTKNNRKVNVYRLKDQNQYLYFLGHLNITKADQDKVLKLSPTKRKRLNYDMALELSHYRVGINLKLDSIELDNTALIEDLNETKFIERVDNIDRAMHVAIMKFNLHLLDSE
jgi:hypothetical protein